MKMVMLRMLSQVTVFLMLTAEGQEEVVHQELSLLCLLHLARVKAEADMAALKARHKLLKQKHALEEQKEQLRKKKEELDLEIEIAASMAKVKVFQGSVCSQVISAAQIRSDGINSYFEHENKRSQMLMQIHLYLQQLELTVITKLQPFSPILIWVHDLKIQKLNKIQTH
ncbi:hypothetical protein XENOCAPTIV_004677 [Xenoophorus captivus]|uniref:Uncharacterized protein n=1 Tax=Xenoophorus captivus TaxID=1517983 RepID=A0ABV0Q4E8_9TELE